MLAKEFDDDVDDDDVVLVALEGTATEIAVAVRKLEEQTNEVSHWRGEKV